MKYVVHIPTGNLSPSKSDEYVLKIKEKFEETDFFESQDKVVYIGSPAVGVLEVVAVPSDK